MRRTNDTQQHLPWTECLQFHLKFQLLGFRSGPSNILRTHELASAQPPVATLFSSLNRKTAESFAHLLIYSSLSTNQLRQTGQLHTHKNKQNTFNLSQPFFQVPGLGGCEVAPRKIFQSKMAVSRYCIPLWPQKNLKFRPDDEIVGGILDAEEEKKSFLRIPETLPNRSRGKKNHKGSQQKKDSLYSPWFAETTSVCLFVIHGLRRFRTWCTLGWSPKTYS